MPLILFVVAFALCLIEAIRTQGKMGLIGWAGLCVSLGLIYGKLPL